MKRASITLGIISLSTLLSACSSSTGSATLDEKLKNPLYAKRYYEELVGEMVNLELNNDPILKTSKNVIDNMRTQGTTLAQKATDASVSGPHGSFVSDKKMTQGSALLLNDTLYIGADMYTSPGPNLHVFLSNAVDPRQIRFPDPSAVDLGVLQEPFGASQYALPKRDANAPELRSVVLWDSSINMLYGFAQLAK